MATIQCPECESNISEYADQCPVCGFPIGGSNSTKGDTADSIQNYRYSPDIPQRVLKQRNSYEKKKTRNVIMLAIVGILIVLGLIIYSQNMEKDNKYVQMVKTATPNTYPNKTYGATFDNFFASPKWKYFKSSDGKDIVEFSGKCMYDEKTVDIVIQFDLDLEDGTMEVYAMEMNEIPQNKLFIAGLLYKVFEE